MNKTDLKKQQERVFVNLFLKHRGIPSETCRDHEEPDFLISVDGKTLGIEVTQLFRDDNTQTKGSRLKAGESRRAKSIRELANRYYESSGQPLEISFAQYVEGDLIGENLDGILNTIQQLKDHNAWDEGECEMELPEGQLLKLYWLRLPDGPVFARYSNWKLISDRVGFASPLNEDILRGALTSKTAKAPNYLRNCDHVWLLMVADRI